MKVPVIEEFKDVIGLTFAQSIDSEKVHILEIIYENKSEKVNLIIDSLLLSSILQLFSNFIEVEDKYRRVKTSVIFDGPKNLYIIEYNKKRYLLDFDSVRLLSS